MNTALATLESRIEMYLDLAATAYDAKEFENYMARANEMRRRLRRMRWNMFLSGVWVALGG